ncbi:dihydroorotase [Desulfurivibrio alkaliphilus]|uniref:Dihydroorotase n=1 Tax=Desulfurivibrio alkaliphilus (strain DSM 19089 / UNIQEM U267 / AHT2) TaxID=589865 RepID=D6Z6Z4_DESAT|nr:dihydroorotase [Desulfurivibrio alkaliphilus]ADH86981.1 dihydroorotase, multifunctional complex type [Desulfurivibrio alkaliphilus AHT 2]
MSADASILLENARLLDPASGLDEKGYLLVHEGRIVAVAAGSPAGLELPPQLRRIDADGRWLAPGLIDIHVHLREPGEEHKETVASGAAAAAAGGFTAVACMPNTRPVNDSAAVTCQIMAAAAGAAARVYPVGAISVGLQGETLAPFGEMRRAGVRAVSDDGRPVGNSQFMRRALEYAGDHDLLVISHAEDDSLSRNGAMNEGETATRLGLRGIPAVAEEIMVHRELALAEYTGRPIHIAHVSTAGAVDLVRRAKARGVQATAETAPHYFTLTEEAVGLYDTRAKMNPPLRTAADVAAIREALADGTLEVIATDHAPHSELEKELEFELAANGIIGLESALPLSLALVRDGLLSPLQLVALMSTNPARILSVPGGRLAVGEPADLTLIDPDYRFTFQADQLKSRSRNSPFLDWEMQGRAVLTIMDGRITHEVVSVHQG